MTGHFRRAAPAREETLAQPGDPGRQLTLVVSKLDFCVLERAGALSTLSEIVEMTSTGSLAADARLLHRSGIAEVRRVVDDTPAAERHQPHRPRRGDAALRRRRPAGGRPPPLATNS